MGTNTGLGIGIGIPFKNNALGGDKPYFPPELKARMIGVWTNYGKKNTDADRNIIKNKIPNAGGDLEILNAAYKLNSGFGEYSEDFTTWTKSSKITSVNSESFSFASNVIHSLLYYKSNIGKDIPSFKIRIKLDKKDGDLYYNYINSEGRFINTIITGEEYVTPVSYNTKYIGKTPVNCGFSVTNITSECSGTITQIPNFEDAFVSDGINDMIVSQKTLQEMGVTKGLTIVSMIHQINTNERNFITTNNLRNADKVVGRNIVTNIDKTGIYGWYKENIEKENIGVINNILGDKADYVTHSSPSTNTNPITNSRFYVTGYAAENSFAELSSVAHYWTFAVLGKATEDEINLIIGNYNLDRSLKPNILCNIGKQGITNENHAEFNDKLIDYSGNGRDVQMNNLAWKGGSGIAAKQYETFKDWTNTPYQTSTVTEIDEFTRVVDSTSNAYWVSMINRTSDFDKVHDSINIVLYQDDMLLVHECKYKIDENVTTKALYETLKSGVNTITLATIDKFTDIPEDAEIISLGEWVNPKSNKGSVKITLLPSYEGGVLLDGINDFGKVTGMPIYKDYTFIIDYERISYTSEGWGGAIVSKSPSANNGALISMMANSARTNKQLFSFGGVTAFIKDDLSRILFWQTKYKSENTELTVGEGVDGDTLWLGTLRDNDSRFFNGAIYSLMTFPYSMSEFLIERQLKKHKLGTLYPNMVEFRPIIPEDENITRIDYFVVNSGKWTVIKPGDYVDVGARFVLNVYTKFPYKVEKASSLAFTGMSVGASTRLNVFDVKGYIKDKTPQKIKLTLAVNEDIVQWNPTITSNLLDSFTVSSWYLNDWDNTLTEGTWIKKTDKVFFKATFKTELYGLETATFGGTECVVSKADNWSDSINIWDIRMLGTIGDLSQVFNLDVYELIRFEDIVQPYPLFFEFTDENGNLISWGGKAKVGSTITRIGSAADSNLLPNIYNIFGLLLNDNQVTSSKVIVEKTMVFKAKSAYIFDDNEPKCILSPRLLRIPNSSYKILGYIPDISGHGNHGVIHNSAYAEGSGVNEDGSYQFDGVDDFVTIPTVTGGKQVLMKVNWDSSNSALLYDQRGYNNEFAIYNGSADSDGNPIPAYSGRNNGQTYIDGILNSNIKASELRAITHNITITNELSAGVNKFSPVIGSNRLHDTYFVNMALYDFMLFDEISTDDKIKELNEYVGIEAKVELPPYYWDTYGKTNSDADRDTIQQRGVAVGDYDLINYNHAYEGMSGYNGYPVVFGESKTWETQGTKDGDKYYIYTSNANKFNITQIRISSSLFYTYIKRNGELTSGNKDILSLTLKVTGLDYDKFYLAYYYLKSADVEVRNVINITSDGIYELPKSFASDGSLTETNSYIGLSFIKKSSEIPDIIQNVNVTIEVLPEYENGLVYDGVEDYSENVNVPTLTDYTYIFKRTLLNKKYNSASIFKGSNQQSGGGAFICDYNSVEPDLLTQGYSFGAGLYVDSLNADSIVYGTRGSVNGQVITSGNNTDTEGLTIGKWRGYKQMVFYKLILYPKTIPLLQINFLKNLMEKDEIIDLTNPIFIKDE